MKLRPLLLFLVALVLVLLGLLVREFLWRADHRLLKPQAPAPGGAAVAEVRGLPPDQRLAPSGTGVYLRSHWELLRSLRPRLVFAGLCDEVETRWFGERRLVIECELRSGEPRLLHDMLDGVVIELIVQRRFALRRAPGAAPATPGPAG